MSLVEKQLDLSKCPPFVLVSVGIADGTLNITHFLDKLPWFKNAPNWDAWRACLKGSTPCP
jgi:hypothetical protein